MQTAQTMRMPHFTGHHLPVFPFSGALLGIWQLPGQGHGAPDDSKDTTTQSAD